MAALAAMFALTHKAIEISGEGLSKITRSKLQRFAELDETTDCFSVSAFLIAQFGKDDLAGCSLSGDSLMASALDVLTTAQRNVGGGVVYLECENRPRLLEFYQSSDNGFRPFGQRFSEKDQVEYIQENCGFAKQNGSSLNSQAISLGSRRNAVRAISRAPQKVTLRLRCSLVNALTTLWLTTNFLRTRAKI